MYSTDPAYADLVPIPQDDGEHPLAQIAYTDDYAEAMSYLRAIMALEEYSPRALKVTEHIIDLNPAHYTVWLYRIKTLFHVSADLRQELVFLNTLSLRHEKNYQIWHHRQLIIDHLDDPSGEQDFVAKMFESDPKNYHVWSYRQWLVRRFGLWDKGEVEWVGGLLEKDVRNNSGWNHRWFVVFGRPGGVGKGQEDGGKWVVEREIEFAETAIFLAPQNPSSWNYLRGVLKQANLPLSRVKATCEFYAPINQQHRIKSSHALDFLAEIYAVEGEKEMAVKALDLLAGKYDPIRANYWEYRKENLGLGVAAA